MSSNKVITPWGEYQVLRNSKGYRVKHLFINQGACTSLQSHHHTAKHWVVVSGTATVTSDGKQFLVTPNQSTYIKSGLMHQIYNEGKIPLEIVEVQVGEYLGLDGIRQSVDHRERSGSSESAETKGTLGALAQAGA
jgi:mannose-6-phosphate isomerase-like protein (cupin superfamily)